MKSLAHATTLLTSRGHTDVRVCRTDGAVGSVRLLALNSRTYRTPVRSKNGGQRDVGGPSGPRILTL